MDVYRGKIELTPDLACVRASARSPVKVSVCLSEKQV